MGGVVAAAVLVDAKHARREKTASKSKKNFFISILNPQSSILK